MTSRLSLLLGLSALTSFALAGCSGEDGGPPAPPSTFPPLGGAGPQATAGAAGQTNVPQGGSGGAAGSPVTPVGMGGGGAGPVATGGTGGAAGGAGGAPGMIPIGTGTTITPAADGWVAAATNQFGIQGSFYTFADSDNGGGGDTTMDALDFTGGTVCTSGVASQVLGPAATPDYTTYWGGGVGLNLADPGTMTGVLPWNRGTVVGFSFNITGPMVPPATQFRFKATPIEGGVANQNYCRAGITTGANTVRFDQIVLNCYDATSTTVMPAAAPMESIQWQIATVTAASTPFDFCIENLTPIVQ